MVNGRPLIQTHRAHTVKTPVPSVALILAELSEKTPLQWIGLRPYSV
jgi:hypothetical protein